MGIIEFTGVARGMSKKGKAVTIEQFSTLRNHFITTVSCTFSECFHLSTQFRWSVMHYAAIFDKACAIIRQIAQLLITSRRRVILKGEFG
jgi:hypothetical protein